MTKMFCLGSIHSWHLQEAADPHRRWFSRYVWWWRWIFASQGWQPIRPALPISPCGTPQQIAGIHPTCSAKGPTSGRPPCPGWWHCGRDLHSSASWSRGFAVRRRLDFVVMQKLRPKFYSRSHYKTWDGLQERHEKAKEVWSGENEDARHRHAELR